MEDGGLRSDEQECAGDCWGCSSFGDIHPLLSPVVRVRGRQMLFRIQRCHDRDTLLGRGNHSRFQTGTVPPFPSMKLAFSPKTQLLDDACVVVEEMGGLSALIDDLTEFRKLHTRLTNERRHLLEKYPDRWVAMGRDGVVAAGATRAEVLEAVDKSGTARSDTVVEFIDTDPPVLIP